MKDHLPKTKTSFDIKGDLDEEGNFIPRKPVKVIFNPPKIKHCCPIFLAVTFTLCAVAGAYIFYVEIFK